MFSAIITKSSHLGISGILCPDRNHMLGVFVGMFWFWLYVYCVKCMLQAGWDSKHIFSCKYTIHI